MVTATYDPKASTCCFILRPNRSLNWTQAKIYFAVISGVCLTVAMGFALLGLWPILPFAGLELAMLGYCFYACAWRAERTEVVTIKEETVEVETGRRKRERYWWFPRAWARVRIQRPDLTGYPSRVILGSHGRGVEIGVFLNETEKRRLATALRESLNGMRA